MPVNHVGNTANGNTIGALASLTGSVLAGRTSLLPIYEVRYSVLSSNTVVGPNFVTVVKSINRDNRTDLANNYRQPTDHDDRDGNLPVAPGGRVVYREYYLAGNLLAWPGFVRLVADMGNRRLFITPTHYDVWLQSPAAAIGAAIGAPVASATAGARNPFYLVGGAGAINDIFI